MKCERCGYDDNGTGDSAHVCRTAAHGEPSQFGSSELQQMIVNRAIEKSKAGSAEQVSERDAFEKWAMPDGMQARTDAEGNYCDVGMSAGWSAWQARAALQHTAPAPSDELARLRGHLTLMPEDEAAFPDGFNVAVIRIDRYWQLREAEEKVRAPSKAGEWTDDEVWKIYIAAQNSVDAEKIGRDFAVTLTRAILANAVTPAQAQSEDAK